MGINIGWMPKNARSIVIFAFSVFLFAAMAACSGDKPMKRPVIGMMTTLPLQWQEGSIGDVIKSSGAVSPAFEKLSLQFDIRPIDNLSPQSLKDLQVLLLAQSRALSPQQLSDLDIWVRAGGKLLLFADPALHWESIYPLGDKRRPLFTSLLSPLFTHWGLELVLPIAQGDEKDQLLLLDGQTIRTITAGAWQPLPDGKAQCLIDQTAAVAKCKIGAGAAILVADADLFHDDLWQGTGIRALMGSDDFANISWIKAQLESLIAL